MSSDLFDGAKYTDGLPKRVLSRVQCDALDEEGNRCDCPATIEAPYYGDETGLLQTNVPWVVSRFCEYHGKRALEEWGGNLPYHVWKEHRRKGTPRHEGT